MGKLSREKGARVEREMVKLHKAIGIHAERVPLSGAMKYQENAEDLDLYPEGRDGPPLCCQVKGMKGPRGLKTIMDALGEADALLIRLDAEPGYPASPPLILLPWATWERLLKRHR